MMDTLVLVPSSDATSNYPKKRGSILDALSLAPPSEVIDNYVSKARLTYDAIDRKESRSTDSGIR